VLVDRVFLDGVGWTTSSFMIVCGIQFRGQTGLLSCASVARVCFCVAIECEWLLGHLYGPHIEKRLGLVFAYTLAILVGRFVRSRVMCLLREI